MGDFYVPENVFLACNKGTCICQLKATNYGRTTIYGEHVANEADKVPNVNVMPMGVCAITKGPCMPAPLAWQDVKDGISVGGFRLLLNKSILPCGAGGKIDIHFSRAEAQAIADANAAAVKKAEEENKPWYEKTLDFATGFAEGVWDGGVGLVEGVAHMIMHPIDTVVGVATLAYNVADAVTDPDNWEKAYDWASKGENWSNAWESTKKWASEQSPRDWGRLAGRGTFEVALAVGTGGAGTAAEGANVAAKAAKVAEIASNASKVAKAAEIANAAGKASEAANAAAKVEKVGAVVTDTERAAKAAEEAAEAEKAAEAAKAERCTREQCTGNGHPVDMATGEMFIEAVGFELPGLIPINWNAIWFNSSIYQGPIGSGWSHSYDQFLIADAATGEITYRTADGRDIVFPYLTEEGASYYKRSEKTTLYRQSNGYKLYNHAEQLQYVFRYNASAQKHVLDGIYNINGAAVTFKYENGLLTRIIDSCQRILELRYNKRRQVTEVVLLAGTPLLPPEPLISYEYNERGCLLDITYPLNNKQHFYYNAFKQIIKHTVRAGIDFYFEYDSTGPEAKCPRTWGDGNILGYRFTFEDGKTKSVNSLGHTTVYFHKNGLVYKTIDPYGHITYNNYNEYRERVSQTDGLGHTTVYTYDIKGNLTNTFLPNGAAISIRYNKRNLPAKGIDPDGGTWEWEYDEAGHLIKEIDPLQQQTSYQYNSNGALTQLTDVLGRIIFFDYNSEGQLIATHTPDGQHTRWHYNHRGQCTAVLFANGKARHIYYDAAGNIIKTAEPDGNIRHITYNAFGKPLRAKDSNTDVIFTYDHAGQLISQGQVGKSVQLTYDTELNLTSVINEEGSQYLFELDANGRVITETGFDGVTRRYRRNAAGQITEVLRSNGQRIHYGYDPVGQITDVRYHDNTSETYSYSPGGRLLTAVNEQDTVSFTYDALGRVVAENTTAAGITSIYNGVGQRTALTSTLGAHIQLERDIMGDIMQMDAGDWRATIQRNAQGWETHRSLPGGVNNRWKTDEVGRPVAHEVLNMRTLKFSRQKRYKWGANNRLHEISDFLSNQQTAFIHNAVGYLTGARHSSSPDEIRSVDAVGNLFESNDHSDRSYAKGGKLMAGKTAVYNYDEEGYLVEKKQKDGPIWKYEWNAAGMLAKVMRPDGAAVTFGYDALGRRVWKKYKHTITRYVWDGNKPLHEWKEFDARDASSDDLITWVFDEDSFAPAAKLKGGRKYSIVADYLGTPVQGFNAEGVLIWERELDTYGRVKMLKGEEGFCNYLYQGQMLDSETGLAYNRFRYYNPEEGMYISQDPIRLRGGLKTYAYVSNPTYYVDRLGLAEVEHFTNFDAARERAFELARGGNPNVTFTPTKVDPVTGTEVEFKGSNGSKVAYDSPHPDMNAALGHDKPHVGVHQGGKRSAGSAKRYNLTYDGDQHPYRSPVKGAGDIC